MPLTHFITGLFIGIIASFTGLGGGVLILPYLLLLNIDIKKLAGTSFFTILILSISAFIAHNKLNHVEYKIGLLLGLGAIFGAQIGARFIDYIPAPMLKKTISIILIIVGIYMFCKTKA